MYDIHTHLYWHTYDADREAVIARAMDAGVSEMLVVGCTVEESQQAVVLSEQYPALYAAVGIHPQEFLQASGILNLESWIKTLRELAQHEKVIAIGECGLEYYAHGSPSDERQTVSGEQKAIQKQGFLAQINLAQELQLPLIVHCRASTGSDDAYRDLLEILRTTTFSFPIILHCYMGDTEVTEEFLKLGQVFFSFTGNITYPVKKALMGTKDDLTETVKHIPLDRLLAETDCPFLVPQSKRGKRNEPAFLTETIARLAELQGKSLDAVKHTLEVNSRRALHQ